MVDHEDELAQELEDERTADPLRIALPWQDHRHAWGFEDPGADEEEPTSSMAVYQRGTRWLVHRPPWDLGTAYLVLRPSAALHPDLRAGFIVHTFHRHVVDGSPVAAAKAWAERNAHWSSVDLLCEAHRKELASNPLQRYLA